MHSYHVYFGPKPGIQADDLVKQVHIFMSHQLTGNHALDYRLLRLTNKASFQELPDFQLIVDYESESMLSLGLEHMKMHYTEEPHRTLMHMVSDFRVAFSTSETYK